MFGVAFSPAIFQRTMETLLQGIPQDAFSGGMTRTPENAAILVLYDSLSTSPGLFTDYGGNT